MTPEQKIVLDASTSRVNPISIKKILLSCAIYIPLVLLVFYLAEITFTILNVSMVIVVVFVYALIKEITLSKRAKKILAKQYTYLLQKHPLMTFYIPLLEVTNRKTYLKLSALFVENDQVFLEAYKQKLFAYTPTDSITIPYGKDFVLSAKYRNQEMNLTEYTGTLVEYDYHCFTIDNERISAIIDALIK